MATSAAVGRVLVRSVAHDGALDDIVRSADLTELPRAAAFHGIAGFVYHALRDNRFVDADVADALYATHHRAALTHLRTLADLREIAPALDALGAPWMVVKGPVLAETVYPRPDLRGYTDLDLVVSGASLGRVLEGLEAAGARVTDANWDLLGRLRPGEVHLTTSRGTRVDLHWHLINDAALRDAFPVSMAELHERARRVTISGLSVPTLDPADTVAHLGLHGCTSGANRLVWLKDMEQATSDGRVDWDEVVERAHRYGAGLAVGSMLQTAHAILGTPVPPDIVRDLAGSRAWPELVSTTARLCCLERTTGGRSLLRLIARATRTTIPSSAAELSRRGLAALRHPMARAVPDLDLDAESPASVFHPAGNRAEFLAAVAGNSGP